MKKSRLLTLYTLFNFFVIMIFIICALPQSVCFKFNLTDMVATDFVGKWYNIIMPSLALITCLIILIIDIREDGSKKHTFRYLITFVAVCVCFYFTWVMMGIQIHLTHKSTNEITLPWSIIILFPIAYFMIANGVMEIERPHGEASVFSFSWVKSNVIVWSKTHKLGGKLSIVTGFIIHALAVLNETNFHSGWVYVVAVLLWFVMYFMITYFYSKSLDRKYNK